MKSLYMPNLVIILANFVDLGLRCLTLGPVALADIPYGTSLHDHQPQFTPMVLKLQCY